MADFVQVVVQVDKTQLTSLQADVTKLNGKTVKIGVDATGITAAKNEIVKLSKTFDEQGNLKRSVKDVEIAFGRMERTIETVGKKGTTVTTTLTNNFKAQAQAAKGAEAAYAKYAAEVAKTSAAVVTPMQRQINAITGVSREFKSAGDSARYFMLRGLTPVEQALNQEEQAAKGAATATKQFGNATQQTAEKSKSLSGALNDYIQWYLRWTIISGAFQAGISSIGKALDTMKAVDAELVTVRKVTGFTVEEMKRVEEQAYKTASAYGVAADAYLESVAAFARAGYQNQSEALAELSTKTQIVGDTTAEVANQFLLSVDAAYKYKGSIEELSKVLDGANELDNKYATSIEKIADGMGIVAPVAAQMHVTIDELAAGIGTITAVTQRSGSEAARALRALFLNIAGDTKTEIDEGVTWTTGEIEGLRDVIKLYAKDAYDAAEATKSVIDPMRAMEGLAKSMQEGVLTEQKLVEMVSDIGGKLRTSQLLAIIQNWDMYSSMLKDFANAAGSADKEVENALNSWERKTQQLSDAWAEFISHLIETDEIKGALDVLIGAVEFLDSGFGKFAITVGLTTVAVGLLSKAVASVAASELGATIATFKYLAATVGLGTAAKATAAALWEMAAANPLFWVAAGAAALYGTVKFLDWMTDTYEEQRQKIAEINNEYQAATSELEQLKARVGELTDEEKLRLAELESETIELEKQLKIEKEIALQKWRQDHNNAAPVRESGAVTFRESVQNAKDLTEALNGLSTRSKTYREDLSGLIEKYREEAEVYAEAKEAGLSLSESEAELLDGYNRAKKLLANYVEGQTAAKEATEDAGKAADDQAKSLDGLISQLDDLAGRLSVVKTAFEDFNDDGNITYSTLSSIRDKFSEINKDALDGYINRLASASLTSEEFSRIMGEMTLALIEAKLKTGELTAENEQLIIKMLEEVGVTNAAEVAAYLLAGAEDTAAEATNNTKNAIEAFNATPVDISNKQERVYNLTGTFAELQKQIYRTHQQLALFSEAESAWAKSERSSYGDYVFDTKYGDKYRATVKQPELVTGGDVTIPKYGFDSSSADRGGSGGSSRSDTGKTAEELLKEEQQAELKRRQDEASYEEQYLSFLEASGASLEERIAQMRKIQEAYHSVADYMREIGMEEKETYQWQTKWWKVADNIKGIYDDIAKDAEKIAEETRKSLSDAFSELADEVEKSQDEATAALRAQLEILEAEQNAREKTTEEAEKLLAVEKAQIALDNARAERTVRQYNARTGQWEWVANAEAVANAEEALKDANQALLDYRKQREIEELKSQISVIETAYKELHSAIKDIATALKNGAISIYEAMAQLGALGISPTSGVASKINGIANGANVDLLAKMKSNSEKWWDAMNSGDTELAKVYAAENEIYGGVLGLAKGSDGVWYTAGGSPAYTIGGAATASRAVTSLSSSSGSIATAMKQANIVTASGGRGVINPTAAVNNSRIQNNNQIYNVNGVAISEAAAKNTTVYDLAQQSRNLSLKSGKV